MPLCRPVAAIMTPPSNKQQSLRAQTKGSLRDDGASEPSRRCAFLQEAAVGVSKQLPLLSAELMSCAKDTAHDNNLPRSTFKGVISCTACGFPTRRDGSIGKEHKVECPACGFAQRKRKRGSRGVRPAKGTKKAATSNQAAYRL